MYKLLDTSTAQTPTGLAFQRRLFRMKSGQYASRLVLLYADSASEMKLRWSDPPYTSWSAGQTIINDSADSSFSAFLDTSGDIHIAYTRQNSLDLIYIRLVFGGGGWTPGSPATVCSVGSCYFPSIVRSQSGELWCAYSYYDQSSSAYSIRIKSSADGGGFWTGGAQSPGMALSPDDTAIPYVNLSFLDNILHAVYCHSRSSLYLRKQTGSGGGFTDPLLVMEADFIDDDFDCAVSPDFKLAVAAAASEPSRLYFREYDGVSFGGLQEVSRIAADSPQVVYLQNTPHIFCQKTIGGSFRIPVVFRREGATFVESDLFGGIGYFDNVLVYDDSAETKFEDKTIQAANPAAGDIYHSESNALLGAAGDCLYLGKSRKFYTAAITLSTVAAGGNIVWEYFNGSDWVRFNPAGGDYYLDQQSKIVLLWVDLDSAPPAWQACSVNGIYNYWIRLRAQGEFTTAPVGSQIAAAHGGRLIGKMTEVS